MKFIDVIECGVPMGPPKGNTWKHPRFPLGELSLGDSFFVGRDDDETPQNIRDAIYGQIACLTLQSGKIGVKAPRFATRRIGNGIRVWRIA